ncbi:NAD(P)-dependent oxidoreductase [Aciduricibacillus chroicocephali]|uniref:precorrin-2 dehydrogenase n=1 Tax=Aciduricibacillus chroicocephali TaxID=3054939 RepID=A0ABY9KXG4_9BACI|nr:NAD(P)-dependent oxidoreductase [Bacillaceae bacterium 44XB]
MDTYPITLHISGKTAVVIGGGSVARRKIQRLLKSGAVVKVVSPDVCREVYELHEQGQLEWQQKLFEPADLDGAFIIMAASGNSEVNELVASAAAPHQLVNIADDPHAGNFHVPASLNRGKLSISVATEGASPILARKVRDEIADHFGHEFTEYMEFLETVRKKTVHELSLSSDLKKYVLEQAASNECRNSEVARQSLLFYLHLLSLVESSAHSV